jgi:hypothetical protein
VESPKKRKRPPLDFNNLPKGLHPEEAAQVLGITIDSYYRYIHPLVETGVILSMRIGRQRLIITSSLLSWQEAQARAESEAA